MSTYEPGTVAVATVEGRPNVKVIRVEGSMVDAPYWITVERLPGHGSWHRESDVTDVRPLVVLDLKYAPTNGALSTDLTLRGLVSISGPRERKVLLWLADQIEAQTKPPRIPEPGLWGVVAVNGRNYVHTSEQGWRSGDYLDKWDDIADGATLVREGIES